MPYDRTSPIDEIDRQILESRTAERDLIEGPRIGDYVLFQSGQLERICCDRGGEAVQTTPYGSFYLAGEWVSFSGGCNPPTPKAKLQDTGMALPGTFWFFHHGEVGPHRGLNCEAMCRVFKTNAPYGGFLSDGIDGTKMMALKASLAEQSAVPNFG